MAATSVYATFQNIYEAVIRDAKESTTVSNVVDLVKRYIQEGYEVVNFRKKRTWLDKRFTITLKGKVDDTFSVTEGSSVVVHTGTETLLASSYELGFKIQGFEENYEISSITGTIVVLTAPYQGDTSTSSTGTIYQRSVILDPIVSEVYQVWHDYYRDVLNNIGPQRMRKTMLEFPEQYDKGSDWAIFGQDNSVEARRLVIWPFPDEDYTLYLDTNVFVPALSLTTDEPLIPVQYRQCLYWYALAQLFGKYHRNTEREVAALANFNVWLQKMDGLDEVSQDLPRMIIDYRRPARFVRARAFDRRLREDP